MGIYPVYDVFQKAFPDHVKREISRSIYAGLRKAHTEAENNLSLPRKCAHSAKCLVGAFVEEAIAEACSVGRLPFNYEERHVVSNSYPYTTFSSGCVRFQIKKTREKTAFPRNASFRENAALSNQLFFLEDLSHGGAYIKRIPFALVVYGHDNFELTFARVGFPEYGRREWIDIFDLPHFDYRDLGVLEERILEDNVPKLKSQFIDKIEGTTDVNEA